MEVKRCTALAKAAAPILMAEARLHTPTSGPYPARDNLPTGRLQTPIHARLALHQAKVDHASAQAGRVWVATLQ
jgi:hypothetical protein